MPGTDSASPGRAVVVPRNGDRSVLELRDRATLPLGPGQLLVEVEASGVNFIDVYRREGVYPVETPFVLGGECAGRVLEVGPDVTGFSPGDLVVSASADRFGSHADRTVLDAATTVTVPNAVTGEQAAAVLLQGMTAHYLVHSTYPVAEGDDVLVHAAAGGVGRLLVQLAKAQGARVVATVGSAAKVGIAQALGADHVLRTDVGGDLAAQVRDLVPDGVHVVYDGVGRATFEASLAALRPRGLVALFGASSGQVPPFDLQRLNPLGSLFVTRPTLRDYVATRAELEDRAGAVLAAVADGTLDVAIGGHYRLDDVQQAYADLEGRATTGKLLIVP